MDNKLGENSGKRYIPIPPTQNEVNSILKRKRKTREPRACYPCRHRKVKCDWHVPCQTCVDRGHADLCSYRPDPKEASEIQESGDEMEVVNQDSSAVTRDEWKHVCGQLVSIERRLYDLQEHAARCPSYSAAGPAPRPIAFSPSGEWHGTEGQVDGRKMYVSDRPYVVAPDSYTMFSQHPIVDSQPATYPVATQADLLPALPYGDEQFGPGFN